MPQPLTVDEQVAERDLVGTVEETFIGEMDPFIVGDVCIIFVKPYDSERWVGLLEEFCDYALTYDELGGFAVSVAQDDMIAVSHVEDEELTSYKDADYYRLDGRIESIE